MSDMFHRDRNGILRYSKPNLKPPSLEDASKTFQKRLWFGWRLLITMCVMGLIGIGYVILHFIIKFW